MVIIRSLHFLILALILTSCSFIQEYRAKSQARTVADHDLRKVLSLQFDEASAPVARKNDFIEFVMGVTSFEVTEVKEVSANTYSVTLKQKTVSPEARQILLEVIKPLQDGDLNAFNFTDGLKLILQRDSKLAREANEELRLQISL